MTERQNLPTPGRFFVRYLIMGLSALLLAIVVGRVIFTDQTQKVFITAAILLANLCTVILYTKVILKDKRLTADPDAPDMAYYLGFSLTVGALALSFIVDIGTFTGAAQGLAGAQVRGHLVENALGQFGAGLLATLFGLCAKIYLGSQQALEYSDPDALYQQFRTEISNLRRTLENAGSDLATSIEQSCDAIKRSGEAANLAMNKIADDLRDFQMKVATELANERITPSISNFVSELERISAPASSLKADLNTLASIVNNGHTSFSNLQAKADELTTAIDSQLTLNAANEVSLRRIIESNDTIVKQQSTLLAENKQTTSSVRTLGRSLEKFASDLTKLEEPLTQINQHASPIADNFDNLSRVTSDAKTQIESLSGALTLEVLAINSAIEASQQLSLASSEGSTATRSLQVAVEALAEKVRGAESTISRLTSALDSDEVHAQSLGNQLQELVQRLGDLSVSTQTAIQQISVSTVAVNNLGTSATGAVNVLNNTPAAVEGFIRPLAVSNTALHQLSASLENLNSQVSTSIRTFQNATSTRQG